MPTFNLEGIFIKQSSIKTSCNKYKLYSVKAEKHILLVSALFKDYLWKDDRVSLQKAFDSVNEAISTLDEDNFADRAYLLRRLATLWVRAFHVSGYLEKARDALKQSIALFERLCYEAVFRNVPDVILRIG